MRYGTPLDCSLPGRAEPVENGRVWRAEDEALLDRLEDEVALERLFRHHVGRAADDERAALPARAAGMIACVRRVPGGDAAVRAALDRDAAPLARLLDAPPMTGRPPELLHHTALYFAKVAAALERAAPEAAANAWTRALAAWLALGEERAYLAALEKAVLGDAPKRAAADVTIAPEDVPLEIVADLGRRAEATSRDLAPAGRAALLALAWLPDAARIAGVSESVLRRAQREAERQRNAALDAALAVVGEALDEANVRGDLATQARDVLLRALEVWKWSDKDDAVEHFLVDRLGTVGWELYRARSWDALRHLLDPFRPVIEHLASRIEADPTKIAYAAPCAQMYVFLSDVETSAARRLEHAERAVRVCPTHRNGRLVLAALLCDQATIAMRAMVLFARRDDIDRVEALVARAEKLYPQSSDLGPAKAMLERVKKSRLTL